MKKKIVVYDQNMKRLAYLENAFDIEYTTKMNELWTASFSLPIDDDKIQYCDYFNFVELFENGCRVELFRIMPQRQERQNQSKRTFTCEHVLATLLDDVLFGYHQIGNLGVYTSQVIRYIIDRQETKRWKLGKCDFNRQFEYKWENENLLSALFSVATPFDEKYQWTFDTTGSQWIINLVKAEATPSCEIRYKKNMEGIIKTEDPTNIVTRLYCLGYGEGVNQLDIRSVNNGLPYLEVASKYGLKSSIWTDRRFEDAASLKATGKAMLDELSKPYISYEVSALDLFSLTNSEFDQFRAGKLVRVVDKEDNLEFNAYIVETVHHLNQFDVKVTIANKTQDIVGSISDLQDRARINDTYAQGATNQMQLVYSDNANGSHPALLKVFIPAEMVRINKMKLTYQFEPFRAYSQATEGGGGRSVTTPSGGGSTSSSRAGAGANETTDSEIILSETSGSYYRGSTEYSDVIRIYDNGYHNHGFGNGAGFEDESGHIWYFAASGEHNHWATIIDHYHSIFNLPHSHRVDINAHYHLITFPNHEHSFYLPNHVHQITSGIFEGQTASSAVIKVDGQIVRESGQDLNIIKYLQTDSSGRILRDHWHEIEIIPNRMTRIVANLFMQIFTNSRGGGNY